MKVNFPIVSFLILLSISCVNATQIDNVFIDTDKNSIEKLFLMKCVWRSDMIMSNIEYCTKPTSTVKAFIDYIFIRRTPACILCDDAMAEMMPMLSGTWLNWDGSVP